MESINSKAFSKAEKLFTLSESMKIEVAKYVDKNKIKIINNWVDNNYIKPIDKEKNPFISKHNLENKKVILYAGNMGYTHDLESLVLTAERLKNFKKIVFLFIGDGAKKDKLEKMVKELQLDNVQFLPYQDSEHFPYAVAAADVGVVTLGTGAEGIAVPSKTYTNMAAGLCLMGIAPKTSELSRLIKKYNAGFCCEPGDISELTQQLNQLIENEEQLTTCKNNARKAAMDFTPDNAYKYVEECT